MTITFIKIILSSNHEGYQKQRLLKCYQYDFHFIYLNKEMLE